MPKTKAQDLRSQGKDELETRLADLKKEQFNLRFQKASGQLANTAQFGNVRRDRRFKTLLDKKWGKRQP